MATTSRPSSAPADPDRVATALQEASLVRILTPEYGSTIAAAGLLARALDHQEVPFQVAPTASQTARAQRRTQGDEAATTVLIGDHADAPLTIDPRRPVETAVAVVRRLGTDPAPVLALAGMIAAGKRLQDLPEVHDHAQDDGMSREPGVGLPVTAYPDGLAHSLLFHAPFSGDQAAVTERLDELGIEDAETLTEEDRRAVASLVAIEATGGERAPSAAQALDRALRPHVIAGPFATIEGYGDVLALLSQCQPGLAVAIALGSELQDTALSIWREQATAVHRCLREPPREHHEDCLVVSVDEPPVRSVARLTQEVFSTEPVVLVIGSTTAAVATDGAVDALDLVAELGKQHEYAYDGTCRVAHLQYEEKPAVDELLTSIQVTQ